MSEQSRPPWSVAQVNALWQRQADPNMHPYTCPNSHPDRELIPTPMGWICGGCNYRQEWARDGDCEIDCQERCAYPGEFAECGVLEETTQP